MSIENFKRDYRVSAGRAGGMGFEVGGTSTAQAVPLHVAFSFQKSDLQAQNTGRLTIWNLNKQHLATLNDKDCALSVRAGYNGRISLIFAGIISHIKTSRDGADMKTEIEVVDNLVEIRDTYVSVSYNGKVNWKTIMNDVARQMGVTVTYSYNAKFADISNGFSFVGLARDIMTKGCKCCGLVWSLQNGVMQVKRPNDVMSKEVHVLAPDTGLINVPARVSIEKSTSSSTSDSQKLLGWEVEYLLNGSINIDDYVKLESSTVYGFFRVHSLEIAGDNVSGDWTCKAQLLEVSA